MKGYGCRGSSSEFPRANTVEVDLNKRFASLYLGSFATSVVEGRRNSSGGQVGFATWDSVLQSYPRFRIAEI
jgi:hypothetical protein